MQCLGQLHAALFCGHHAVFVLLQQRRRHHIGAFRDGLCKQPTGFRRSHQIKHTQAARGFARNGHVPRIATERADIVLDPFERSDLIEESVIAGDVQRRFCAQLWMGQPAQNPQPVVDRDDNDASLGQPGAVI